MIFRVASGKMRKSSRVFGWLAVGSVLSVLLAVVLATAVQAANEPQVLLDPTEGKLDDRVHVEGTGLEAAAYFYLYFSSDSTSVGSVLEERITHYKLLERNLKTTDETALFPGEFYTQFRVPDALDDGEDIEDVHGGEYYVYVTSRATGEVVARAVFSVPHGEIELAPETGMVGSEVTISGEGLRPDQVITLKYDGTPVSIISGDITTNGDGEFSSTIAVPEVPAGEYTVTAVDESGNMPQAEFSVVPQITLSPTSQDVDRSVEVRGTGFASRESVIVTLDGTEVVTTPVSLHTNRSGSLGGSFVIPPRPAYADGSLVRVGVRDESDNAAEAELTVLPISAAISLSPATSPESPGHVGMELTVGGIWFVADATLNITYDDGEAATVATAQTSDSRTFTAVFTVPPSASGSHEVTASDGTNSVTAVFTMESERPLTPVPLQPAAATVMDLEMPFDWEDVSDPSGITYVLQVAADSDFTTIVFEKKDLASSEYTPSGEERLKLVARETPYYWRVKAVDGTLTESYWTVSSPFYVGSPQGASLLPGWMKYLWIGVGCGLAAFFIVRARRKHAESQ
jgi:hypothetical protein